MNVRPPAWDKYEAVILLEGMIDIKQYDMPRNIVVERVSQDLRKMARNRGIGIDELAQLLEDDGFLEYNAKQHNRFRAALSKFVLFVDAAQITVPLKPSRSADS